MSEYDQHISKALADSHEKFSFPQNRWHSVQRIIAANVLSVLIIMTVWQLVSLWIGHSRGITFPSPWQTSDRLFAFFAGEGLYDQYIYQHLMASLERWASGYLLAVFIGILVGLALGSFTVLYEICMPVVHVLQLIPGLANSWRVLIAAEMIVGTGVGLGYSIIQSRWSLDFEAAFACVMIICFIGLAVEKLFFEILEKRIMSQMGLGQD